MSGSDVSGSISLSRNELLALLRRFFEALFGKSCDYEAMAEQIVWLECHGLGGLDLLRGCLTRLDREGPASEALLPNAFAANNAIIDVDAGGTSLLCFGDLLADVLIARCAKFESLRVEISNLREGQAIVPQLHRLALAGYFAAAHVRNAEGGSSWYAHVSDTSQTPGLSGWEGTSHRNETVSISLICTTSEGGLQGAMHALDPNWPEPTVSSERLTESYSDSLDKGISVGELAALNAIANRVLVEATEESRRGAGE